MVNELDLKDYFMVLKIKNFLNKINNSDYMQSIEWHKIRSEKVKYFLYKLDSNNEILWTCNLLEKEKNNEKILYAPRGPVLDFTNKNNVSNFLSDIEVWASNNNYSKLIINPYLTKETLNNIPNNYLYKITRKNDYSNLMDSCKLAIMEIIPDEEKLISLLPSKFRQNTRRSYRKGLICKISKKVDFDNFYKLYIETSIRHKFNAHDIDYFKNIYKEFKDKLIFLEVWYGDLPLAMSIDIIYNDKLIYLYGVSSSNNRNLLGMYNLQWEAIKYCIKNSIPFYDFGGVFCEEGDLNNKDIGLYNFKKGYCYKGFIDVIPDITFEFKRKEVKQND